MGIFSLYHFLTAGGVLTRFLPSSAASTTREERKLGMGVLEKRHWKKMAVVVWVVRGFASVQKMTS
jgi:hypothetical protein